MATLRILVLTASMLQLAAGAYAAQRLIFNEAPDLFGLFLCSTVIVTGAASLMSLRIRPKPSVSRQSTVQLNLLILGLLIVGASIMLAFEHRYGGDDRRIQLMAVIFACCAMPFLINWYALGAIERRVRKLA